MKMKLLKDMVGIKKGSEIEVHASEVENLERKKVAERVKGKPGPKAKEDEK